jgi:DtxR family Mn-dependent transcriptional regulator
MQSDPPALSSVTSAAQQYLVELARLEERAQPATLAALARVVGVSLPSALETSKRLDRQGLVSYQGHQGIRLTDKGRGLAQRVLGRHRLWETMLVDQLGLPASEAHTAACLLEHATTEAVAAALDVFLGRPPASPSGEPVYRSAAVDASSEVTLADLRPGDTGRIVRASLDAALARFAAEQGLVAGAEIRVRAAGPRSVLVQTASGVTEIDYDFAAGLEVLQTGQTSTA